MNGEPVGRGSGPFSGGRSRRLRWWAGGVLLVAVAASVLAAFGWNAAEARTPSPSPSSSAAPGYGWWGPRGGPWAGGGGFFGVPFGGSQPLHGEVVVAKDGGGTETLLIQKGEVIAVSATSIEVKSTDGFTKRYVVTADTKVGGGRSSIGSVATGDSVVVCAVAGTGGPTARSLIVVAPK